MTRRLGEVAHCRSGDKGDTVNVSLIPWSEDDFELIDQIVTVDFVRQVMGPLVKGEITRYTVPGIKAFNLVMTHALDGGVSRSLNLDIHGKSWGCLLMDAELPEG